MPDVCIGYVHAGVVHEKFMRSVLAALAKDKGEHLGAIISASPANIAESRCDVVQMFLDDHAEDWLWFIDTDIVFDPGTHLRLLEAADPVERPIVSAVYYAEWTDDGTVAPVWAVWRDDELKPVSSVPEDMELVRLAGVGMGCCLIHRTVLERMRAESKDPWPWFGHDAINTAKGVKRLGEDFTFCLRALRAGFPIYGINHTVGHRKTVLLDESKVREAVAA